MRVDGAIVALYLGPDEARPGPELPGVAGAVWHYADAFVSCDSGALLRLWPCALELVTALPKRARALELRDERGNGCLGRRIADLVFVDEETHLVVLDDGRYLTNRFEPGGTRLVIGSFDSWEARELEMPARSLTSGGSVDLRRYGALRP